jgi:hypothetical protein
MSSASGDELYLTRFMRKLPLQQSATRLLLCGLAWVALLLALPAHAEIWRCVEGYTNQPDGKTDCKVAGAAESCAEDGSRYFAPHRGGGHGTVSGSCRGGDSVFDTSRSWLRSKSKSARQALSGSSGLHSRTTTTHERKGTTSRAVAKGERTEDIFYCLSHSKSVAQCNWLDLGHFVKSSLNMASDGL